MKQLQLFFAFLILGLSASAQEKNLDSMIHKIFHAVNNQDEEAYLKLFPTRLQFMALLKMESKNKVSPAQDSMIAEMFGLSSDEAYSKSMRNVFLESFGKRMEEMDRLGINKGSLSLVDYTYKSFKQAKDSGVNGVMFLKASGKDYEMKFKDLFWSPLDSAWMGLVLVGIIPKGGKYPENKINRSGKDDEEGPPVAEATLPQNTNPPAKPKQKGKQ